MVNENSETAKKSGRERQTLFRAAYGNQSNLIQIADNKANLIIGINTMIISSLIAITGYGAVADKLDLYGSNIIFPLVLIILTCLVSALFAIQAARPKIIVSGKDQAPDNKSSLLFFGEIVQHSQADYVARLGQLLDSRDEIYEHMSIDLYNQGLVLSRKYVLLNYAYRVFMLGFAISVLVFLLFISFF
jgi:hypothetical protein